MIGIVVAMPEERKGIMKQVLSSTRTQRDGVLIFTGSLAGLPVCVVEGGMGTAAATRATRLLITEYRPELVVSAGFCGSVLPGPRIGDLVLANRILAVAGGDMKEVRVQRGSTLAADVCSLLGYSLWDGCFITTEQILAKADARQLLPADVLHPVLEMESAAVALAAGAAGLPFLGFRSISDDAAEELAFSLDDMMDDSQRISIPKVLSLCLKSPRIIPQLVRLGNNSRIAATSLGLGLKEILPLRGRIIGT